MWRFGLRGCFGAGEGLMDVGAVVGGPSLRRYGGQQGLLI